MLHADGTLQVDLFNLSPPRSGNTWVAWCLDQHPSIAVGRPGTPGPYKRPEVFRAASDTGFVGLLEDYRKGYEDATPGQVLADFSTYQLADGRLARERIHAHNPEARSLVVLRDPVTRLFDHYRTARRYSDQAIPATFEDALAVDAFVATSRYGAHLEHWADQIDDGYLLVVLDVDLLHEPAATLAKIYDHVGVNRAFLPPGLHIDEGLFGNETATITTRGTRTLGRAPEAVRSILRTRRQRRLDPVALDRRTERRLVERLAPDMDILDRLLGRDLEAWRRTSEEDDHRDAGHIMLR